MLEIRGQSKHRNGERRTYRELLEKKVKIAEVMRLQREPDPDDISAKLYDYSSDTISQLIIKGVNETLYKLSANILERERHETKRHGKQTKTDNKTETEILRARQQAAFELQRFIDYLEKEKENEQLTKTIETSIDHEYGSRNYIILKGTTMYDVLKESAEMIHSNIK